MSGSFRCNPAALSLRPHCEETSSFGILTHRARESAFLTRIFPLLSPRATKEQRHYENRMIDLETALSSDTWLLYKIKKKENFLCSFMEMARRSVVFLVVKGACCECYRCQRDHLDQKFPLGLQTDTCSRGAGPHPAAPRCLRSGLRETTASHRVLGFCCQQLCGSGNRETKAECFEGRNYLGILALQEGHSSKV